MSGLANLIGRRLLPFDNPRVVAPPGRIEDNGAPNIIVATPMRSGTHIMIDLLLNNLPAYRRRPLYIDLDQYFGRIGPDGPLNARAGYIVKTHYPIGYNRPDDLAPPAAALAKDALVITVTRPETEIARSLGRWSRNDATAMEETAAGLEAKLAAFRAFWDPRRDFETRFADLFDQAAMRALIGDVAARTGTATAQRFVSPPEKTHRLAVYAQKALTRLLGARAPRINTTIFSPG